MKWTWTCFPSGATTSCHDMTVRHRTHAIRVPFFLAVACVHYTHTRHTRTHRTRHGLTLAFFFGSCSCSSTCLTCARSLAGSHASRLPMRWPEIYLSIFNFVRISFLVHVKWEMALLNDDFPFTGTETHLIRLENDVNHSRIFFCAFHSMPFNSSRKSHEPFFPYIYTRRQTDGLKLIWKAQTIISKTNTGIGWEWAQKRNNNNNHINIDEEHSDCIVVARHHHPPLTLFFSRTGYANERVRSCVTHADTNDAQRCYDMKFNVNCLI